MPPDRTVTTPAPPSAHTGVLRRALRNTLLLLTGKGAAGAIQLATLALTADGLGVERFGLFSMLGAVALVVVGIAAFDSNQAIVRYGVLHLQNGDRRAFQALLKAGTLLDALAAAAAAACIIAFAPLAGRLAGWDAATVGYAPLLAPLAGMSLMATPKGMLRLFDRFDLLPVQFAVAPAARLIGTLAAWLTGGDLGHYLLAWSLAAWIGVAVALLFGWREAHRRGLLDGFDPSLRHLSANNAGMFRFALTTNLNGSIALLPTHLATFLVGIWLTPASAGLFRVAREVGGALAKPVELLKQVLLPDIARMVAAQQWARVGRAAVRAGAMAGALGLASSLLAWALGAELLALLFGEAYSAAAPLLAAMLAATAIRVVALAADPVLYALGKPASPLAATCVANVIFVVVLSRRAPVDGLAGAGWAFVALAIVAASLSIMLGVHAVRRAGAATRAPAVAQS